MYRPGCTPGRAGAILRVAAALVLLAGTLALGGCFGGGGGGISVYGSIDGYVYYHADARGSAAGEAAQQPEVIVSRLSTAPPGYLPLSGARILAVQAGRWTYSNSSGYFILTTLSPGTYDVSITHERFINGLTYPGVRVVAGQTTHLGEAKLGSFFYLIIGINDYPDEANDLHYAVADADLLESTLWGTNGYAGKVVKLTDQQATKAGILNAIAAIGDEMSPDGQDYFVMTFSGHGASDGEPSPDPGDPPYECLVASDGQAIYDYELRQCVAHYIPASPVTGTRYCTFIFDSCRSGGMFKGVGGASSSGAASTADGSKSFRSGLSRMARNLSDAGYVVITACDDTEVSYESSDLQNGVFTEFSCEGLANGVADSNEDGLISAYEALSYAAPRVQEYVSAEFGPGAVQTPQLFASPDALRDVPIYRVQ